MQARARMIPARAATNLQTEHAARIETVLDQRVHVHALWQPIVARVRAVRAAAAFPGRLSGLLLLTPLLLLLLLLLPARRPRLAMTRTVKNVLVRCEYCEHHG